MVVEYWGLDSLRTSVASEILPSFDSDNDGTKPLPKQWWQILSKTWEGTHSNVLSEQNAIIDNRNTYFKIMFLKIPGANESHALRVTYALVIN